MELILGKEEFYKLAEEAFKASDYIFYNNKAIKGKSRSHASKPDYIAYKNNIIIIGEIKSHKEPPESSSWRQIQNSDTEEFKKVRVEIAKKEETGKLPTNIGGHEIIIRGQIPDYISKIGKTYDLPSDIKETNKMLGGYTFPSSQLKDVKTAFNNAHKKISEIIDTGNGSISIIYIL
ncbi:MAG: hypothetical protein V1872_15020 [bacterium]